MPQRRPRVLIWRLVALLALPAYLAGTAKADEPTSDLAAHSQLRPYTARYTTRAYGLSMALTRSLSFKDDQYTLQQSGDNLLVSLTEVAHFGLANGQVMGQDFYYRMKSFKKRERRVEFLPTEGIIRSLRDDVWTEHPWHPGILDRLSQQAQMRLALKAAESPPETITLEVIDGPRVSEKHFALVGEELLETALGSLNTLHYRQQREDNSKRESDIWLAPSLDYLNVLTVHIEKGKKIEVALKSVAFEVDVRGPRGESPAD